MAIGTPVERYAVNRTAQAGTTTLSPASNITVGTLAVMLVGTTSSTKTISSVSDNAGNTWTVDAAPAGAGGNSCAVASCQVAHALTTSSVITITWTTSVSQSHQIQIQEVSGLAASSAFDKSASANGTSLSPSAGPTATLSQASEIVFGVVRANSPSSWTKGASYSNPSTITIGTGTSLEYKIVAATTAVTADGTLGSSVAWFALVATYKGATIATVTGAAAIAGAGSVAATGTRTAAGAAAIAGAGTVAAIGRKTTTGSVTIAGAGTVSAAGYVTHAGAAAITGGGTIAAAGQRAGIDGAAFGGIGTIAASGFATKTGTAQVAGAGALAASGLRIVDASAAFGGAGALVGGTGRVDRRAGAEILGGGDLAGAGLREAIAAAVLGGVGQIQANGFSARAGSSDIAGAGAISATGRRYLTSAPYFQGPIDFEGLELRSELDLEGLELESALDLS